MDILLYSALNIGLTPLYGVEKSDAEGNHTFKTVQAQGIAIFAAGDVIFKFIRSKKINMLPNIFMNILPSIERTTLEESVFRLAWQTFFNSLIFVNFKEIIIDDILVLIAQFIMTYLN